MKRHRLHRNIGVNLPPESTQEQSSAVPSHEEIEALAYQLWIFRARPLGSPEVDWFRAEAELKSQAQALSAAPN